MKLTKENIAGIFPCSALQQGILAISLIDPENDPYKILTSIDIEGDLDAANLEKCINYIAKKYAAFNTIFEYKKSSSPIQIVMKEGSIRFFYKDFSNEINQEDKCNTFSDELNEIRFDFTKEIAILFALVKISESKYRFFILHHHILLDGWSFSNIFSEIFQLYSKLEFSPIKNDLALLKNIVQYQKSQSPLEAKEFWIDAFKEFESFSNFDLANASDYNREFIQINEESFTAIKTVCRDAKITLANLLQAIWALLLSKINYNENITFGTPTSGRNIPVTNIETYIGMLIQSIPIPCKLISTETLLQLSEKIKNFHIQSANFINYPIYKMKKDLEIEGQLFDSLLVVENYPIDDSVESKSGLKFKNLNAKEISSIPINIIFMPFQQLNIEFNYNSEYLSEKKANYILQMLKTILCNIVKYASLPMKDIQLWEPKLSFEDTRTRDDISSILLENFQKFGSNPAITGSNRTYSYEDIKLVHNKYNEQTKKIKIPKNRIIPVMGTRTPETILAFTWIIERGCAYLPLDDKVPKDRFSYILNDSQASIVLISSILFDKSYLESITNVHYWLIYDENNDLEIVENLAYKDGYSRDLPDGVANVIYTSGTTGNPKGTIVFQKGIVSRVDSKFQNYNSDAHFFMTCSIAFDAVTLDIWGSLLVGGTLFIEPSEAYFDPNLLEHYFKKNAISLSSFSTGFFHQIAAYDLEFDMNIFATLKDVIIGGDKLQLDILQQLYHKYPKTIFKNVYGPTENTVVTTSYTITGNESQMSIGKPIAGAEIYIVDCWKQFLPPYFSGEMVLIGDGVAGGYWNNKSYTDEVFKNLTINDKIVPAYFSGDLAYRDDDEYFFFEGRNDDQIKLRGFRIELKEIESRIREHTEVQDVIVYFHKNGADKKIYAFIKTFTKNTKIHLEHFLPEYMIPSKIIYLEKYPLTTNGKVDKKSLLALAQNTKTVDTKKEIIPSSWQSIVEVWEMILQKEVTINTNFFSAGGHSISAIRLISILEKKLKFTIALRTLFENPILSDFCERVKQLDQCLDDKIMQSYNPGNSKIYCFPPASAYSIMYSKWSQHLPNYEIIGITIPSAENFVDVITDEFLSLDDDNFIFMGYSGGANLAFDVALKLIEKGRTIKHVIMIDGYFRKSKLQQNEEEYNSMFNQQINRKENSFVPESMRQIWKEKMMIYAKYLNETVFSQKLYSKVTLLTSESKDTDESGQSCRNIWKDYIHEYNEINGFGIHAEMFIDRYFLKNLKLIYHILEGNNNGN